MWFGEDEAGSGGLPTSTAGQQTNDVGNTVIVPKNGEKFSDTMARAAAQGKKTTQADINREVATMPKRAAVPAAPMAGA